MAARANHHSAAVQTRRHAESKIVIRRAVARRQLGGFGERGRSPSAVRLDERIRRAHAVIIERRPDDDDIAVPAHGHAISEVVARSGVARSQLGGCGYGARSPSCGGLDKHVSRAPVHIVIRRADDDNAAIVAHVH